MQELDKTFAFWKNQFIQSFLPFFSNNKMDCFYLEKKGRLNKERLVHRENCELLPEEQGRIKLGISSEEEILSKAKSFSPHAKCCKYCVKKDPQ